MVLYDANDDCIWSSCTDGQGEGCRKAKLKNDGRFMIVDSEDNELWCQEMPLEEHESEEGPNWQDRLCGQNGTFPSM